MNDQQLLLQKFLVILHKLENKPVNDVGRAIREYQDNLLREIDRYKDPEYKQKQAI